ncbi:MAG: SEL1-like repeat protein [Lentisphaeria bacterium]|nr:SEL1-like repeat protein [Lentisphaeria bacterium]
MLGACCHDGDGVAPDKAKAVYWFRKADVQGNETAKEILKKLGY